MLYLAGLVLLSQYYHGRRDPIDLHLVSLYRIIHLNPRVHDEPFLGLHTKHAHPRPVFRSLNDRDTWTFLPIRPMTFRIRHKASGLYLTMVPDVRHRLQGSLVWTETPNAWSVWEVLRHPDRRVSGLSFAIRLSTEDLFTHHVRVINRSSCPAHVSVESRTIAPGEERVINVPTDRGFRHRLDVRVPRCGLEWSLPGAFLEEDRNPAPLIIDDENVQFLGRTRDSPPRAPQFYLHADTERVYVESRFHTPRAMWLFDDETSERAWNEQQHAPEWLTSTIRPEWIPSPKLLYANLYWWLGLAFLATLFLYMVFTTYAMWSRSR